MSISAFPKIFAVGTDYISGIFEGEVEITEKIDGSQFVFGKIDGELHMRSKGAIIYPETRKENDLFYPVIQFAQSVVDTIPDGMIFYGETLCKPKHNVLKYGRTPKNNFMIFAMSTASKQFIQDHDVLQNWAHQLGCEAVPLLYRGEVKDVTKLHELLDTNSILGDVKMEGFVVKNYAKPFLLGGQPIPVMAGKYVSEAFKEVHRTNWSKENTGRGRWELFKESFRTEARWDKAIQHLREKGELENEPKDIGKLMAEIKEDIVEEEKEAIKNFLWQEFGTDIIRSASKGFPEYYKKKLLERGFENA